MSDTGAGTDGERLPIPHESVSHRGSPAARRSALLRWQWHRIRHGRPPSPSPSAFGRETAAPAMPRAHPGELGVTWVGHSTVLLQAGGLNILTDPVWSDRASPLSWAGPRRLTAPAIPLEDLPPIDLVLLSHDHYDHLDTATVDALHAREGDGLVWAAPTGFRRWFARRGVRAVMELGWWQSARVRTRHGAVEVRALPARHWSQRRPFGREHRAWASWGLSTAAGHAVYFGGDSGYFGGFRDIGERAGPFDLSILPIGAYEPRWFMRSAHMNPEDAVQAYRDLGGRGAFLGVHWAGFRLTDEDPLEPPVRTREAWRAEGLDTSLLHLGPAGSTFWPVRRSRSARPEDDGVRADAPARAATPGAAGR